MDIQHDRAGYYICWGCLVWVPAVYTSQAFYLATNCPDISNTTAAIIYVIGLVSIYINYESDRQRYVFRQSDGNCLFWGTKPKKIIASYTTAAGDEKKSLLLVDGWWSWSRHFHYVPEVTASICWGASALHYGFVGPYFYPIYLSILLLDRAFRDDDRCKKKYGLYWDQYCEQVPYKVVPKVL